MTFNVIDKLKTAKQKAHITNEELASMTGIPVGTLNKLLSGSVSDPKFNTVLSICSALGCSISELVGETPKIVASPVIEKFNSLDDHGRELVTMIIDKEFERCNPAPESDGKPAHSRRAIILPLYDLPVSAGTGVYLDGDSSEDIRIEFSEQTKNADFALRISGNSMMPKYNNGDIILVDSASRPKEGELGIFVCDGEGYFKKFGGNRLISLNPDYKDIDLSSFSSVDCRGKVIGRLK